MSNEIVNLLKPEKKDNKEAKKKKEVINLMNTNKRICGVDIGTMNIVCASNSEDGQTIESKVIRNMYLTIDKLLCRLLYLVIKNQFFKKK